MVDPSLNIFVLCSVVSGFIVGLHPWLLTGNFTKNIQTEKQRVGVNQFNLKNGQTEQDNIILIINHDNSINSSNSNNIIKIITTLFLSPG